MKIRDSVALVTGANRGLGAAFAHGLLADAITSDVHRGLAAEPPVYVLKRHRGESALVSGRPGAFARVTAAVSQQQRSQLLAGSESGANRIDARLLAETCV